MTGFSLTHWLILLVIVPLYLWIHARIARKAGFSGWWSVAMLIPLLNIVLLWMFAFVRWPVEDDSGELAEVFD